MLTFSCIFVWNIAELAIVPTTCRIQPISSMKSTDLEAFVIILLKENFLKCFFYF